MMVRIGDTRGGCWDGEQEREGECREEGGAERERERETRRWLHAVRVNGS